MHFGCAARFARVEGEVRAEDFLEGGFFQRKVFRLRDFAHSLRLFHPLVQRFEPMRGVPFKLEDLFLKRPPLVLQCPLPREIIATLNVLLHEQVGEAGDFVVENGNGGAKRGDRRFRAFGSIPRIFLRHTLHFFCPFARQVEARKQIGEFCVQRFFAQVCAVAFVALFGAAIVHIAVRIAVLLHFGFLLSGNGTSALAAGEQTAIRLWVIFRRAILVASLAQNFLHLVKKFL
ncbi:hypothetical protein A2765_04905 [Candidatus Kaiserbacteria bacterium RIFCSPHIGHO2_01_FULL_56_24]|uniref:Uncharacterized protein n=1 Tax=Candidatus Kaiserbacteria bacterium RIFCSPHIGHO2_01_FULL_56_24 TaxID=1798487 RepID=A0A1F6DEN2_9BACT|nr:MAG: hypothetical protein A2765_04905 [Candidatus Kaiserbacteria bacterium RIFCSPHIGHO2_01_FULL_56_24]